MEQIRETNIDCSDESLFNAVSHVAHPSYEPLETSFDEENSAVKRFRTRILNFISFNYLSIIKFLVLFIILMFIVFAVILIVFEGKSANSQVISSVSESTKPSDTTNITTPVYTLSSAGMTAVVSNSESTPVSLACARINCNTVPHIYKICYVDNIDYWSIRTYVCCGCLDNQYTFIRYSSDRITNQVSIVLKAEGTTPKDLSDLDLKVLPPLQHLQGVWDVVIESEIANWLVFKISGFDTYPENETIY